MLRNRLCALMRSLVIWDHTVLPATGQRRFSRLYPSVLPVLIYRPRKDKRLSWPRWLVIPRWFTCPQTVTHPSINQAHHSVTILTKTKALPLSQATITTQNTFNKAVTLDGSWFKKTTRVKLHCVPKKTCDYIFYNNFNNRCPITIIFGIVSSKSMRHQKMVSFPTSPI